MSRNAVRQASEALHHALNQLEASLFDLPEGEERSRYLRALQRMAHLLATELQVPLAQAASGLVAAPAEAPGSERGMAKDIGQDELNRIDAWLLEACSPQWRQAARVAGTAVGQWPELPIALFAERLQVLAGAGHIEARGDLAMVLQSEVRRLL